MFKVGDLAVYPAQGVCIIEAIEAQDVMGMKHEVYVLRIVDTDMRIMVPLGNVDQVGLRVPTDQADIDRVFAVLEDRQPQQKMASWSRRQRVYNEKIKTGALNEVAEVMRELCEIRIGKDLSYGEKKVLELTERLLVKEVAAVKNIGEDQVRQRLDRIFH